MSVRIIKQKQEQQSKTSFKTESNAQAPVLIESMLLLMPDQSQSPVISYEQPPTNSSILSNHDYEPTRHVTIQENLSATNSSRRSTSSHRVHVPVHNATQWFNGPNLQNERTGRMEKVIASLVRRSYRPSTSIPKVPILTSPSSRDHAHYKGKFFV